MGRFGVAAEPVLDAHDLIDALVTGADHLCELVGRVVACLENPWRTALFAPDGIFGASISKTLALASSSLNSTQFEVIREQKAG
jgi:hypothetical protein